MRLRQKVILTAAIVAILLIGSIHVTTWTIMEDNLSHIENKNMALEMMRLNDIIQFQGDALASSLKDWAEWNETYSFLLGENRSYVEDNLMNTTLANLGVNAFIYYGLDGETFYTKLYGMTNESGVTIPLEGYLEERPSIVHEALSTCVVSVIYIGGKGLIIAAQPVYKSSGEGPAAGAMLMAKRLDGLLENMTGSEPGSSVELRDYDEASLSGLEVIGGDMYVRRIDLQTIQILKVITGHFGEPAALLELTSPRRLYQEGLGFVYQFITAITAIILIAIIGIIVFIEKSYLFRLKVISSSIDGVNPSGEIKPLNLSGSDELNDFVAAFNKLLLQLDDYKRKLVERERLAAIGETSAMVGHDLRNPLQTIFSTEYMLSKRIQSDALRGVDPEQIRMLSTLLGVVRSQAEYMNKIVSDLQDYSRSVQLNLQDMDACELFRSVGERVQIPWNVELEVRCDGVRLVADRVALERAFSNLVSNAVQAMPEGGKIMVEARRVSDTVVTTVSDTGLGVPEENLRSLFTPFFTTKAKGMGLGLAVCKRLIEAHGGTITASSTRGRGTTFTIMLPARGPGQGSLS